MYLAWKTVVELWCCISVPISRWIATPSNSLVPQHLPRRLDVCIEVLLGRLAAADPVARVVVGEHVAVDPGAQADVEAAHLTQVHRITVGEEHREPGGERERERDLKG